MEHSKRFWRGLFFILLITALCGGLALPIVSVPVRAAPQMQTATNVVISEFRFRGSAGAGDEFIELYNPTNLAVNLNGWQIRGSNNSGGSGTRYTFSSNVILQPGQHYLISQTGYDDAVTADAVYLSGITDDGGFALFKPDNSIADQVGLSAGSLYKEGTTLVNLTGDIDQSYERKLGGTSDSCVDTDDNSADFQLLNPSSPQNSLSPLSLCGVIPPMPTFTSAPATATSTSPASTGSIVISEFRTRGPNGTNDEFIEIYNPTISAVDISGWKINASDKTGAPGATLAIIPASTLLRSGQYYLVANNGYTGSVTANLKYGAAITNDGGIALLTSSNAIVDEVGMDPNSFYNEGTTLPPFSGTSDQSYERKLGGTSDSCVDTNDNANDFGSAGSGTLHNYASPLSLCGVLRPAPSTTTTTITADSPDPSLVNGNVSVSVKVTGGSSIPTGLVNITGANTICTINLNSSGTGSCTVKFTSTGTKALIATYLGDNTHASSTDGESHLVTTTTAIKTPTRVPTPLPPPPLIGINEFVPRPGHDWNHDGVINTGDEYIELLNHGVIDVNLSGYSLDDEVNIGSEPYHLPAITLKPGERHVFYGSETGLLLSDGGDGVRLLKPNGQLMDAYNYFVVRFPDQSYCRLPDNGGLDDWNQNCFPTPGLQNSLSGSSVNPPTENGAENLCPISDTLPEAFVLAECPPFGNNIWNPDYWDKFGWFDEKNLPEGPGKWPIFAE
jgi:lamin tail-like protein